MFTTPDSTKDATLTLKFEDVELLNDLYDPSYYDHNGLCMEELHSLFGLVRKLSQQGNLDDLASLVKFHIEERYSSSECWVAGFVRADGEYTLFPPVSARNKADLPAELIRETCATGEGILKQLHDVEGRTSIAAAPVMHQGRAVGALALRITDISGSGKRELRYLLAIADCLGPFLRAVEALSQTALDQSRPLVQSDAGRQIIGNSPAVKQAKNQLRTAARVRGNILILGETGVGKELAARMVHELSSRADGPYVAVNCAAVSDSLFESEFFGHVAGSFTGAMGKRKGYFQLAHGGTLFLDEIGELSPTGQARLLRAVETGTIRPVGADGEVVIDVRIVAAANRQLAGAGANFRFDLYNRISTMVVHLPPLRERNDDVLVLARQFLQQASLHSLARPSRFSEDAEAALMRYPWPGNVRELKNVVERACQLAAGSTVHENELLLSEVSSPTDSITPTLRFTDLERQHLLRALNQSGNVEEAAKALGVSKSTLYYRMGRLGITPPRKRKE